MRWRTSIPSSSGGVERDVERNNNNTNTSSHETSGSNNSSSIHHDPNTSSSSAIPKSELNHSLTAANTSFSVDNDKYFNESSSSQQQQQQQHSANNASSSAMGDTSASGIDTDSSTIAATAATKPISDQECVQSNNQNGKNKRPLGESSDFASSGTGESSSTSTSSSTLPSSTTLQQTTSTDYDHPNNDHNLHHYRQQQTIDESTTTMTSSLPSTSNHALETNDYNNNGTGSSSSSSGGLRNNSSSTNSEPSSSSSAELTETLNAKAAMSDGTSSSSSSTSYTASSSAASTVLSSSTSNSLSNNDNNNTMNRQNNHHHVQNNHKNHNNGSMSHTSSMISDLGFSQGFSHALDIDMDEDLDEDEDDDDDDDLDYDDDGEDHAIPDDGHIPNHEMIWKPQSTTSTCEFTHTITNYSQKRESGCKKAEYSATTIDSQGNRWRLIVYVNGNGRASNHHLSLFLQVADADDLPFGWKKGVSYVLTLEHPSGPTMGYAKRNPDKTFKLCPKAIDWGWSQFITSDRVQQEGYIHNDTLTVRASVTVKSSSICIDPDDAELYLKCAVEEGNAKAVEICLEQGASVNCKFKDDLYTPLHTACSSSANDGSLEVLKLLLKRGANGNACNKWKETPLLIAANNGHRAAVEALLENGADPSMCSEAGWSALTFAAHKGYEDIVSLLLAAGAPVNCRVIEDFSTPLHKACAGGKTGHLSAVKQLIAGDADVHSLNKWRETPLLTAANHGQASAVEALLDAGGDPCKCTDTGWSPLSIAAYKGHDDVVRLLLEQGAPTEEADPTLSALLQAATKGLPDTVELLLRHGADHTVTTKKGDTALSILVEQNLIDAAVEMVTEYKASVPRCSRDRKKVQRARLLINLRIKQHQREGLLQDSDTDEGSDHDDSDEGIRSALHDSDGSPKGSSSVSSKKKKKKGKSRESAEAQAKKAEEALLLELDQEDAKAQKDEAAANSKRNKKKKKKERERQQKLEEERLRKEKERKLEEEKERKRQLKEQKDRKEREAKEKERKEKEMREAAERERIAAKRREKEEKERKKREQAKREQEKKDLENREREKKEAELALKNKEKALQAASPSKQSNERKKVGKEIKSTKASTSDVPKPVKSGSNNRGWETKNNTSNAHQPSNSMLQMNQDISNASTQSSQSSKVSSHPSKSTVEDELENMANSVVGFLSDGEDQSLPRESANSVLPSSASPISKPETKSVAIESAALSVVRQEKVNELLQRALSSSQPNHALASVDIHTVKTIIYKWIVRASYDSTAYLDPIIPSWTDSDQLVAFFQRQIISESNRAGNMLSGKIEFMKDAGSFLANLCISMAQEVLDFNKKFSESLPTDSSDVSLHMSASEVQVDNNNTVVAIDWGGRSKVYLPALSFSNLRHRYRGPQNLILTSIFSTVKRYETLNMIISGTSVDCRLPFSTLNELVNESKVSIELMSDPLSVVGNNFFCGYFADVDILFGGSRPFSESGNRAESLLTNQGGSAAVLPPLDSTTASTFMKRITDSMEVAEGKGLPVSIVAFLPMLCFRELKMAPMLENLDLLEPRLLTTHRRFLRHFEYLAAGQHAFNSECGNINVSQTGSIVLFLQNDAGVMHYPLTKLSVSKIIQSLSVPMLTDVGSATQPSQNAFNQISASPRRINNIKMSPSRTTQNATADLINNQSSSMSNLFPSESTGMSSRRRGRLFDLVDDGEDEFTTEVSGMLNNLNVGKLMFENNQSQDVDIEAISLGFLGIDSNSNNHGNSDGSLQQGGRFG